MIVLKKEQTYLKKHTHTQKWLQSTYTWESDVLRLKIKALPLSRLFILVISLNFSKHVFSSVKRNDDDL